MDSRDATALQPSVDQTAADCAAGKWAQLRDKI